MDINNILASLGLDFSNPDVKQGALDAIEAILASRAPDISGDFGSVGGGETEVELDPDLLQPSIKHAPSGTDDDIEVEDEENILDQIKHNDSEEPVDSTNSTGNDSDSDSEEDSTGRDSEIGDEADGDSLTKDDTEKTDTTSSTEKSSDDEETDGSENAENKDVSKDASTSEDEETDTNSETSEAEEETATELDDNEDDNVEETEDSDNDFENDDLEDSEEGSENDEDDFDFDEDDLIDDELKDSTEDEEIRTKHDARKIKRERTLAAAKKALADAQAKKVSPAMVRELEQAIEALEALTEAVSKSIKDISDAEFNQLINRVFDAIQACGDSDLTFTSEEEREAQVKEIKDDISSAQTQTELSAEDAAKIRAETQAIKAREKETDKYKTKSAGSFKGFQEFLNSLYRAIALQVSTEETRDDSWSAISRRNSGAGVLRQGQKINELPNKKIPIIDFYFDQSSSWSSNDLKVGMKAVSQLADMEEKGQIKLNIFYFADEVSTTPTRGGTSGWNEIVKNVIATQATNVVIMTDNDMENWWVGPRPLSYTVPGYVWYLWKNGENAPRLPRDLKGRGGVQQFSFNTGDA